MIQRGWVPEMDEGDVTGFGVELGVYRKGSCRLVPPKAVVLATAVHNI